MNQILRILSALLLFSLLVSCAPAPSQPKVAQSSKNRAAPAQIPSDDIKALTTGGSAFALELYKTLGKGNNLFFSPYSISLALAMTYAGARGETETQMAKTLHFTLPQERLHPTWNALDLQINASKDTGGKGADGKGFRLHTVNDLWGQQDYKFLEAYLDLLATNYGAGMRLVDFVKNSEGTRKLINDYIAEKTEQRIKDLIPQGAIDPATRLVLTNAIYFNAAWMNQFDKNNTKDASFTRLDGSTVMVPLMMRGAYDSLNYAKGSGYQAVALPYEGGQLSMLLLVPDAGQFDRFEASLDAAALARILGEMKTTSVRVGLPKFQLEGQFSLKDKLSALGMKAAFSNADFSGIDGSLSLSISEVIHKSFVRVDESGTEAAAATAVIMRSSMPVNTIDLTIDRPFIFLIRDEPTGAILFLGRVVDPK